MQTPIPNNLLLGASPWWSSALTGDRGAWCVVIAGLGVVVLAATLRAMWRLSHEQGVGQRGENGWRRPTRTGWRAMRSGALRRLSHFRRRLHSESGTATVEFLLVFVVALWVCLILLQTVLMFTGNLFVHYAAFAATRSAIVQVPANRDESAAAAGEGTGMTLASDGAAFDAAWRAAAYAMMPVSGKLSSGRGEPVAFRAGLDSFFSAYQQPSPPWVGRLAGQRLTYALRRTTVQQRATTGFSGSRSGEPFGPRDPLTLEVSHRLHLSIPYASALFSDGKHGTLGGTTAYADVSATCTMTIEGTDRSLPPLPEIERE